MRISDALVSKKPDSLVANCRASRREASLRKKPPIRVTHSQIWMCRLHVSRQPSLFLASNISAVVVLLTCTSHVGLIFDVNLGHTVFSGFSFAIRGVFFFQKAVPSFHSYTLRSSNISQWMTRSRIFGSPKLSSRLHLILMKVRIECFFLWICVKFLPNSRYFVHSSFKIIWVATYCIGEKVGDIII